MRITREKERYRFALDVVCPILTMTYNCTLLSIIIVSTSYFVTVATRSVVLPIQCEPRPSRYTFPWSSVPRRSTFRKDSNQTHHPAFFFFPPLVPPFSSLSLFLCVCVCVCVSCQRARLCTRSVPISARSRQRDSTFYSNRTTTLKFRRVWISF